jgi:Protein of unknown function (DUF3455)
MKAIIVATGALLSFYGQAMAQTAPLPATIAMPDDKPLFTIAAYGVQIYECKAAASGTTEWTFKEPRADLLINGAAAGKHGAGPFWQHSDGSRVVGKVTARADAPAGGNIPYLRLDLAGHTGTGLLSEAKAILRVNTRGGTLSGPCTTAGQLHEVPYTADYIVIRK